MMTRLLIVGTMFQDHAKSITLAIGAVGIWIAQTASDAMDAAEKIGGWSAASVLALVCIALSAALFFKERNERQDRKDRDAKQDQKDQDLVEALQRNSQSHDKMSDAIDDLKSELSHLKAQYESVGRQLMEKGLNAPPVPHSRATPITKRNN